MKNYRFILSLLSTLSVVAALTGASSLAYAVPPETQPTQIAEELTPAENPKSDTVSINIASAKQIAAALKGVGLKKAQAIIERRKSGGAFTNIEQLLEVKGIGKKILIINKDKIRI